MMRTRLAGISVLLCVLGVIVGTQTYAQTSAPIGVDENMFPVMRARVLSSNTPSVASKISHWTITDNGEPVLVQSCKQIPLDLHPLTEVVVCVDVSNSVTELNRSGLMKLAAEQLINRFLLEGASVALVFFDNKAHIGCDFTRDKPTLYDGLQRMFAGRATSVVSALEEPLTGALSLLPRAASHPTIVMITDSEDPFVPSGIISTVRMRGASASFLGIGALSMPSHAILADSTGGLIAHCAADSASVLTTSNALTNALVGSGVYELQWRTPSNRNLRHEVRIQEARSNASTAFYFMVPEKNRARLEAPQHLSFGVVPPSRPAESFLSLTAVNGSFTVDSLNFISTSSGFSIHQEFPVNVDSNTTANLALRFAPRDTGFVWTQLKVFVRGENPIVVNLTGGKANAIVSNPSLFLVSPRGGEEYFVDSYVPVSWEGSEPGDMHRIEISTDSGKSWELSADSVRGNGYLWHTPTDSSNTVLIRVSHRGADSYKGPFVQQCILKTPLRIRNSRSFFRSMEMNPTIVGERKDKIFDNVFTNSSVNPITIEGVEFLGEFENEFFLSGGQPPITIAPGASHSFEFSFVPQAPGIRSARVHLRTSIGFVSARISGVAVTPTVSVSSLPVNFGNISIGEERTISLEPYLSTIGNRAPDVRWVELRGPDTAQFSFTIPSIGQETAKKPLASVAATFSAKRSGRTSAQVFVHSDADDSPHVLQLIANGVSYQKDVTSFRGIVSPTAASIPAGTVSAGTVNILGVTAAAGITDNIMIHAGGALPVPLGNTVVPAFSIGAKASWEILPYLRAGIGYQFAKSVSDNLSTDSTESSIVSHIPYAVLTYGDDYARAYLNIGYVAKHHTTIAVPQGFNAPVTYAIIGGDVRVGSNWKIATEILHAQSLGTIPITATARYLARNYTVDAGIVVTAITSSSSSVSSPLYPVLSATWVW